MEEQEQKLMMSLVLVIENLRNPDYLKTILKNLGDKPGWTTHDWRI
jgi:hypothetical protein